MWLLIAAATAFAAGGLFMKLSVGLSRPLPTAAFLVLFAGGAVLQAIAMRNEELGVSYILVLGAEAVLSLVLSIAVLGESCPPGRIGAIALVLMGIVWLRLGS